MFARPGRFPRRRWAWGGSHLTIVWLLTATRASSSPLDGDPVLEQLEREALQLRPELRQVRALVLAGQERIPQAGALPDPTLSLAIQNDGFKQLNIGVMESSYWQIGLSQTLPWFGKRSLRRELADLQVRQVEADLERLRLGTRAEVRRGYVGLLLVREQLVLLTRLEGLWLQSEGLARIRYEAGAGSQSDLLRVQLERIRLRQQRWALEAEERRSIQSLNRLRAQPLDQPIGTGRALASLADPALPELAAAIEEAESHSPELAKARLAVRQAEQSVALAQKGYFPDFTVSAAVMPRGSLEPMWQAGLSFNLPIWSGSKQTRAVEEERARGEAAAGGVEAVRQLLRWRVQDRLAQMGALLEANRLYRGGLLVQSEATVSSALAQYRVGRATFATVLEALAGYLNDQNGFLQSVASAERVAIAQEEVSLEPVSGAASSSMGGGAIPGAGATVGVGPSSNAATGAGEGAPPSTTSGAGGSMTRM